MIFLKYIYLPPQAFQNSCLLQSESIAQFSFNEPIAGLNLKFFFISVENYN